MPVNWPPDFYITQKWEKKIDNGGKRKHIEVLIPPTLINVLSYFISVGFTSKPPKASRDCSTVPVYFYALDVNVDSYGPFKILCYFMYKHSFCVLPETSTHITLHFLFTLLSTGASMYWCNCTGEITSDYGGIFFYFFTGYL